MNNLKSKVFLLIFLAALIPQSGFCSETDDYLTILNKELDREFEILSQQTPKVHYMDYRLEWRESWECNASFGKVTRIDSSHHCFVKPTIRVGTPEFDNYHVIKGKSSSRRYTSYRAPFEPGENALSQLLWRITDTEYSNAKAEYRFKKNNIQVLDEKQINDFAPASAQTYFEPKIEEKLSKQVLKKYEDIVSEASKVFLIDNDMMSGSVRFQYGVIRKYFVSSEGHSIVQNFPMARISIRGSIRSAEGNQMNLHKNFDAFSPEELPSKDAILASSYALANKLVELKNAPLAEPFSGPAILSPEAAGVFFHEIFGHRIEGHRLKDETNGQTFKSKVNESVLPKTFNVTFDPTVKEYGEFDLSGYYSFDDQGIKSKKVTIVEDGVLKDFLMCRTPIDGFAESNGHGRGDINNSPVSRQSNMFVETSKPMNDTELRKSLIKQCKKQGLEYGYYFKKVTGGFTSTGRYRPNAFNVTPNEVYRVYVDGRPDELVRGVDIIGTPLAMFSTILAGGDTDGLFNGYCGAESGRVPVATVSPAILVSKIETQKKGQRFSTGPILTPPAKSDK